jgi:hypothetical protein
MTDESKPELKLENLELNKETVQELTEQEGDQARGGMVRQTERNCNVCTYPETGCI